MLAVAGILAPAFFETYEKVGVRLVRYTWLNVDLLWVGENSRFPLGQQKKW